MVTKIVTILTKCFFPYLNPTSYLNAALQTVIAKTSEKGMGAFKYSDVDLPAEKMTRALVECLQ